MITTDIKNKIEREMETSSLFFQKNIFAIENDFKPEVKILDTLSPWESIQNGIYQLSQRRRRGTRTKIKGRQKRKERQSDISNTKKQLKAAINNQVYSLTKQEPKLPTIDQKYRYFTVDRDEHEQTNPNPFLNNKHISSEETPMANKKRSSTKILPLLFKNNVQENYNFCAKGSNPSINGNQSREEIITKQKNRRRFVEDSLTNGIHESKQKMQRRLAFFANYRSSLRSKRNKLKVLSLDIHKIEKSYQN